MTRPTVLQAFEATQDARERAMDPRLLSSYSSVRFPVQKIKSARLIWLNHGWFLEHDIDTLKYDVRHEVERCLIDRYAVGSVRTDHAELTECQWLEADLYGGSGGARHGGSGRCGLLGAFNAKGIGKTPLVPDDVDHLHSSGLLSLKEAIREAIFAEICRKELPYGAVPILAIIDAGFAHRSDSATREERCAIVVRPNFIRPAHFERSIFFGSAGTPTSPQFLDACRVRQSVRMLNREVGIYPSVREMFTRFARQLGTARARRLWQGRFLSSNVSIDGAFIDFGAFRTVPNWRKCVGLAGECFGTEVSQLRVAFASVLYYYARYSDATDLDFEFKSFYAQLTEIENEAFLDACFEGLGVARDRFGKQPVLQDLLSDYYRVQQATPAGDDADGEPFSIYQLLCGFRHQSAISSAEYVIAENLIKELDRLEQIGLPASRDRTRMFFEPRWRLKYANSVATVSELERQLADATDSSALVYRFIENEYSASVRTWGPGHSDFDILEQATDVASYIFICRNLRSGMIELRAEGPLIGDSIVIMGQALNTKDWEVEHLARSERRGRFTKIISDRERTAMRINGLELNLGDRLQILAERSANIKKDGAIKEHTHRVTSYPDSAAEISQSAMFGHALRIHWAVDGKRSTLGDLSRRLWPAIRLKQIEFLFNSNGAPVGFVTWAFLTNDCAEQLRANPDYILHLSEWNEGDQLWLLNVVAMPGQVRNLLRKLRDKRLNDAKYIRALKRRPNQTNVRQVHLNIFRGRDTL